MDINFHKDSEEYYNSKILEFTKNFKEIQPTPLPPQFNGQYVSTTITDDHILEEPLFKMVSNDEVVAFRVPYEDKMFELDASSCALLNTLINKFILNTPIKSFVTFDDIIDPTFKWIRSQFRQAINTSYCDHIKAYINDNCQSYTVWIPIAHCSIQGTLKFCDTVLLNVSPSDINNWKTICDVPIEQKDDIDKLFLSKQKELQGHAILKTACFATQEKARLIAKHKAKIIVSILSLFSRGAFIPDKPTLMNIRGEEYLRMHHSILNTNDNVFIQDGIHKDDTDATLIDQKMIHDLSEPYLNILSKFAFTDERNQFQDKIINSILIFADGTRQKSVEEKLIFYFMALESFLLKDLNEPIMQNVGERFAYIVGNNADERIEVFDNFKRCYDLRSKFVHHSRLENKKDEVQKFLLNCNIFFSKVVQWSEKFTNTQELIKELNIARFT